MLAENPGLGRQFPGVLSGKTVLVGKVTGEQSEPLRPLRHNFWYALVRSVENSDIFKSVVTNGSSDYRLDAEIISHRRTEGAAMYTSILSVTYRLIDDVLPIFWSGNKVRNSA